MEKINKNASVNFENKINNSDIPNISQDSNKENQSLKSISVLTHNELKKNLFPIDRKIRYSIYIMELLCLLNFDQGAISASTKEIKNFFKMSDRELGSFGGISFLGTTLGGIFSLSIINKINRRYLILFMMIISLCFLFFPTVISSKIILI